MRNRRSLVESCWLFAALFATNALSGGCVSPFASATAGFVDLEPAKPSKTKDANTKAAQAVAAKPDDSAGGAGLMAASSGDSAYGGANSDAAAHAGSGFPPIGPNHGATDRDLAALAVEMQSLGTLSSADQQALLDDLKQSDPSMWPQLVRQFRAAIAYRKERGQRPEAGGQGEDLSAAVVSEASQTDVAPIVRTAPTAEPDSHAVPRKSANRNPDKDVATAGETLPGEPPLRPALKVRDHEAGGQVAGGNSNATTTEKPPTKPAADSAAHSEDWQLQLTKAILAMEGQSAGSSSAAAEVARQLQLRLLYLTAGRRDDALRPVSGLSTAQQEFWTKEIYGLVTYLDSEKVNDPERRATEAALHLRDAAARIGELATPVVRNLAFCKEVTSFGVYKKFPKYEFKAGDEALLYCEIENLKAESTDKGYHTSVKSSYQILDGRGERVAEQEFPESEDICASQRRDFFIPYFIWIPKRINDGTYTVQLTVEDTQTKKVGQSSIQFKIGARD
ncbi:MAG TPA: hypothetical protein VG056_14435 [Pirellulales bacterium]|nr:hypothetical protein [Pirellulales bacterium]